MLGGENSPEELSLHPLLLESADEVIKTAIYEGDSGTFTIPSRATAVFVHHAQTEVSPMEDIPESQGNMPVIASSKGASSEGISSISLWILGLFIGGFGVAFYLISRLMRKRK